MIFATDLDNTMIFSHKRIKGLEYKFHCVEYYDGKPITYMTYFAINMLKSLLSRMYVIPVTTRSIAQFKRIEFFSDTEFAVADNGGVILHNGMVYPEWDKYIQNILKRYDLKIAFKTFSELPNLISPPRIVDGKFVFAKSDDTSLCEEYLKSKLDTKMWQISFQGKKVYAIPAEITKGNALRYISEILLSNSQPIISAGDSNLDISMLEYASYSIIPKDSKLSIMNKGEFIETGVGIYSADEILKFVNNIFNKM